ncbi:hypothetical protein VIGAN_04435200 [Vigna angularis var. angularis]|uniref:Uncharacterized protein n=1 Tax=Vigna angularis var. angularis TaxID=157739 RepID=A0A0S3S1G7_PHAAN|nr:hypothetical protein VIGAN_04435200 [Vigna angularis var. angularis]
MFGVGHGLPPSVTGKLSFLTPTNGYCMQLQFWTVMYPASCGRPSFTCFCMLAVFLPSNAYLNVSNSAEFFLFYMTSVLMIATVCFETHCASSFYTLDPATHYSHVVASIITCTLSLRRHFGFVW